METRLRATHLGVKPGYRGTPYELVITDETTDDRTVLALTRRDVEFLIQRLGYAIADEPEFSGWWLDCREAMFAKSEK